MSTVKSNINALADQARSHGLRVSIEHRMFLEDTPVRIYSDGRIKHTKIVDRNHERSLKGQHVYARGAKAVTIARLFDGRKVVSRGFAICSGKDRFVKNLGTVRALSVALKGF